MFRYVIETLSLNIWFLYREDFLKCFRELPSASLSTAPWRRKGKWRYRSMYSRLVGGEWLTLRSGRFTPWEKVSGTQWIGGCVGFRAGLDDVERKIILPYRESDSNPWAVEPVGSRCIDWLLEPELTVVWSRCRSWWQWWRLQSIRWRDRKKNKA
jgi:hypothetical protein